MKLSVPKSDQNPQVRITVKVDDWITTTTLDDSYADFECQLPPPFSEDDAEVFAEFLGATGEVDRTIGTIVLKTRVTRKEIAKDVRSSDAAALASASTGAPRPRQVDKALQPEAQPAGVSQTGAGEAKAR